METKVISAMKIVNSSKTRSICQANMIPHLSPLFEAMLLGKKIKSVTFFNGFSLKNNRKEDIMMKDFIAQTYLINGTAFGNIECDLVLTDAYGMGSRGSFCMQWVLSYELYPTTKNTTLFKKDYVS